MHFLLMQVPPRPRGQRPEPETTGGQGMGGFFSPFNVGGQDGGFQVGSRMIFFICLKVMTL